MAFTAITSWIERVETYLVNKRTQRAAKKKEGRDRKICEKRSTELRHSRSSSRRSSTTLDSASILQEPENADENIGPYHVSEDPESPRMIPREKTLYGQASSITLDLGRIQAGEIFHRQTVDRGDVLIEGGVADYSLTPE